MEFDFKELVARAHFDYVGPLFPNWWKNNKTKFILPNLMGIGKDLVLGGRYFTTLSVADKAGNQYLFPNEPLLSISLAKTIVETATVGKERKGTVKEYICTEDYNINIKGVCVNENDPETYPAEQVAELKRMFEINDSLEVISNPFLELFEIRNIVLKDVQFDEMAGEQGLQKFTMTAVSDQDFYADLNEREKTLKSLL
ncbi:DUF6046 domain-containing protein [Epilithonimonas arachidiradicis]|uniref:DUF6046 domain-containing protein n=1 Tax=Epilithonimonas arachidiradicis TaxID=1617282 RepID=A0A420DDU8_9FLAO|nr:DUF6046 domain-containing protein [Epilithonimonas arachidiradicis]RKE90004.1 hypothetical protein BXY58_0589 [Epilithonimonas arachidiradicis]GGG47014.1 hypothetical protein GCM10007332_05640 [Epilithonimonas arachidiradicis]